MDGMEFLEKQAATPLLADVPVVVMTAFTTTGRRFPSNVKAVLEKPLALQHLLKVIQDVLNAPATRH
jgi:CheY-like chemotaxis protein